MAFWTGDAFVSAMYWLHGRFRPLKHVLFTLPAIGALCGIILLWREGRAEAWLFGGIVLTYALPYTTAMTFPSYRLPIEPLLVACTALWLLYIASSLSQLVGARNPRLASIRSHEPSLERS